LFIIISIILNLTYSYSLNSVANQGYRWKNYPIYMELNSNNSDLTHAEAKRVINKAMDTWNSAAGINILKLEEAESNLSSSKTMSLNGINAISFSKDFFSDTNGFDPDLVVAVGGQYGKGGIMTDGFVIFNAQSVVWETDTVRKNTNSYTDDLETIALHELGHVLGLGHSEQRTAVMSGMRLSRIKKELTQDDIDGILYLTTTQSSMGSQTALGCGYIDTKFNNFFFFYLILILSPILTLIRFRQKLLKKIS